MPHVIRAGLPLLPLAGAFSFIYMIVFSPTGLTPLGSGDALALTPREQTLACTAWMAVACLCQLACSVTQGDGSREALARAQRVTGIALPALAGAFALLLSGPYTPLVVALALGTGCTVQLAMGARAGSRVEPAHMAIGVAGALLLAAGISCVAVAVFPQEHLGTAFVALVCTACGCLFTAQDSSSATHVPIGREEEGDAARPRPAGPHDLLLLRYDLPALAGGVVCAVSFGMSWNEPAASATAQFAILLLGGKAVGALALAVAFVRLDAQLVSHSFDYTLAVAAFSALAFWLLGGDRNVDAALFVVASFSQVLFIGLLWVETAYTGRDLANPEALPLAGAAVFLASYVLGTLLSFVVPGTISTSYVPLGFLAFAYGLCIRGMRKPEETERYVHYDRSLEEAFARICQDYRLSRREGEVLPFLVLGLSTASIGERLFVSPQTIKSHSHRIYTKLGIHSHDELVAIFEEHAHVIAANRRPPTKERQEEKASGNAAQAH